MPENFNADDRIRPGQYRLHPARGVIRIDRNGGDNFWYYTDQDGLTGCTYGHMLPDNTFGNWPLLETSAEDNVVREFAIEVLMDLQQEGQHWLGWEVYPAHARAHADTELARLKARYIDNTEHLDFRLLYVERRVQDVRVEL